MLEEEFYVELEVFNLQQHGFQIIKYIYVMLRPLPLGSMPNYKRGKLRKSISRN